jgi:type III restriction enzyme
MGHDLRSLCKGLEAGTAGLLERVTPTTAELLRWWFGRERVRSRAGLNFHEAQRRAILHTIASHEWPGEAPPHEPLLHRVRLPAGVGRIRVLLALLVWQLLNHNDALASGIDDPRFTRHFMAVAPHPLARDRLLSALRGQPLRGAQDAYDFGTADLVRLAELLVPTARRDEVFGFACGSVFSGADVERMVPADGVMAITDGRLEALEWLARLPDLMVFDDEPHPPGPARVDGVSRAAWREHLQRIASAAPGRCVQVVFSDAPIDSRGPGGPVV